MAVGAKLSRVWLSLSIQVPTTPTNPEWPQANTCGHKTKATGRVGDRGRGRAREWSGPDPQLEQVAYLTCTHCLIALLLIPASFT